MVGFALLVVGAASKRLSRSTLSLSTKSSRPKGSSQAGRDDAMIAVAQLLFAAGSRSHEILRYSCVV